MGVLLYGLGEWKSEVFPVRQIFRITSLFGESRNDHFHTGIDFAGVQRVYPIKEGEVIFIRDVAINPTEDTGGYGNLVVIEHPKKVRSYYYHLKTGSIDRQLTTVDIDTPIGMIGSTGRSIGAHLHFSVEEYGNQAIVNPLSYLPEMTDTVKPKVHAILFKIGEKIYNLNARRFFDHRDVPEVFVVASDLKPLWSPNTPITAYTSCGIYRVALYIDEVLHAEYQFDSLWKQNKQLLASRKYPFHKVFGYRQNYRFGSFIPKKRQYRITAECEDWAGNISKISKIVYFTTIRR